MVGEVTLQLDLVISSPDFSRLLVKRLDFGILIYKIFEKVVKNWVFKILNKRYNIVLDRIYSLVEVQGVTLTLHICK